MQADEYQVVEHAPTVPLRASCYRDDRRIGTCGPPSTGFSAEEYLSAQANYHWQAVSQRSENRMTTAIIGAGSIGSALAANLARGGEDVVLASRSPGHAQAVAGQAGARAASVGDAIAAADVVVLAVWFDVAEELLARYAGALRVKIIVDPSNPVVPDGDGGFTKILPAEESAGQVLAALTPPGARFVKAFGTQTARTLAGSSGRRPPAAQFYATDDQAAGDAVADLIRTAGYAPVLVGGIGQSIRIEAFGDLHETTLGRAVTEDEAKKLI
ncbi:MAG: NADPH-dependent F420 reductase [Trebonia sp.]